MMIRGIRDVVITALREIRSARGLVALVLLSHTFKMFHDMFLS